MSVPARVIGAGNASDVTPADQTEVQVIEDSPVRSRRHAGLGEVQR
jgi:hypothetical protein